MKERILIFAALVRVELRGILPFAFGVALCAVLGCAYMRFSFGLHAPLGGAERTGLLGCVALLAGVPIVAAAFDPPGSKGMRRALQPLPVRGTFLARVVATLAALATTSAVAGAADAVLAILAPPGDSSGLSLMLADPDLHAIVLGVGTFALLTTLFVSTLLQHALGATLLGFCVSASPLLLLNQDNPSELQWGMTYGIFAQLGPLGLLALCPLVLWAISTIAPLRGARARSLLRRIPRAAALPMVLVGIPAAGFAARTLLTPAPAWDDPEALIQEALVSPDQRWIAVTLVHPEDRTRWQSFWLVNAQTYERREIPHPCSTAEALMRPGFKPPVWTRTSDALVFADVSNASGARCYDLDGEWKPEPWAEDVRRRLWLGGWRSEPTQPPSEHRALRSMVNPRLDPLEVGVNFPVFPNARPFTAVAVSLDGELIACDSRTGEVAHLGMKWPEKVHMISASPNLNWVSGVDTQGRFLLGEIATGRVHEISGPTTTALMDREQPLLGYSVPDGHYFQYGPGDERQVLDFPADCSAKDLDGKRWLVRVGRGSLSVLSEDGEVLTELRGPHGETR